MISQTTIAARRLIQHSHQSNQRNSALLKRFSNRKLHFSSVSSSSSSSFSSWAPVASVVAAMIVTSTCVQDEKEDCCNHHQQHRLFYHNVTNPIQTISKYMPKPSSTATPTTSCDFLFFPRAANTKEYNDESSSSSSSSSSQQQIQQKQTSRNYKRNKTMALIESFIDDNDAVKPESAITTAAPSSTVVATPAGSSKTALATPTVDTKYDIDWNEPLGVGSFGGVYKGIHKVTGRQVAIKQIPKQCTEYTTFQNEMSALATITKAGGHPNINTLHETFVGSNNPDNGTNDDNYYLVLDLITGGEMFDQLCDKGAYTEADAARLIRQIASALVFLHDLDLVHSDLKPENLMLTSTRTNNAVVQLVDFGCAKQYKNETNAASGIPTTKKRRTGLFSGNKQDSTMKNSTAPILLASTPAYSPPEAMQRDRTKPFPMLPSFDMWSLGVIIFVMLTASHPFDLENEATNEEIKRRIVNGELPSLDNYNLSDDAKELILGLLNSDPKQRWTATQVLNHPWVQGKTAKSRIIDESIKLKTFRRHKSAVIQRVFKTMLVQSVVSEGAKDSDTRTNMCLLEAAFRQLDQKNLGFISTKEIHGDTRWYAADAQLSYSELSDVLSDTIANLYFPHGHVLYEEGQKGDTMFFLNSGSVEVTSSDGFVQQRNAGEFFGEEIARKNKNGDSSDPTYKSTAVCTTPVHVFAVSRDCFEKYMDVNEDVALTMAETDRLRNRERSRAVLNLNKNMKEKTYKKNEILFEQGSKGSNLYLVKEGDVDIFRDGYKVRTLKKGEMTGEHAAFYEKKDYNVTAKCVDETCKIGVLKGKDMHALFRKNPALEASFYDIILRRDFKKAICAATKRKFPETEDELLVSFDAIVDSKKRNDDENDHRALSLDDLRRVMLDFDPSYTEKDIQSLLKSMDLNNSGNITWEEFKVAYGMAKEA